LMSASRLAEPRAVVERAKPGALRKSKPSPEQLARSELLRRALRARAVSPSTVEALVKRSLGAQERITSAEMQVETVPELRAYQQLQIIALAINSHSRELKLRFRPFVRGFSIRPTGAKEVSGPLMTGLPFELQATSPAKVSNAKKP
jgi:hypothetical protein